MPLSRHLKLASLTLGALALGCPSPSNVDAGSAPGAVDSGPEDAPATDAGVDAGPTFADPFSVTVLDESWLSATTSQNDEQPFDLGEGPFSNVTLIVDLDTACQPFESWGTADNPIPTGHNWPAACDAFDRNMNLIVDKAVAEGDPPGFALLRSVTPFGGPRHIEVDVTDWANAHPGAHRLWAHITTWTDGAGQVSGAEGGWSLSASFEVTPGPAPRDVLAVLSLFEGELTAAAPAHTVDFPMPEGATRAELHYVTSGHGVGEGDADCIGPADEFCQREHTVSVDGESFPTFVPWRTDCGNYCRLDTYTSPGGSFEYCTLNPCGAVQSVQAPRANWCPGDDVDPFVFDALPLDEGLHTVSWEIAGIAESGTWGTWVGVFVYGD